VARGNLSLAIGKRGQNARLAARLSGYKINIKGEEETEAEAAAEELRQRYLDDLLNQITDLSDELRQAIANSDYNSVEQLAEAEPSTISTLINGNEELALQIVQGAQEYLEALAEMTAAESEDEEETEGEEAESAEAPTAEDDEAESAETPVAEAEGSEQAPAEAADDEREQGAEGDSDWTAEEEIVASDEMEAPAPADEAPETETTEDEPASDESQADDADTEPETDDTAGASAADPAAEETDADETATEPDADTETKRDGA
jgi:hypothetical protein